MTLPTYDTQKIKVAVVHWRNMRTYLGSRARTTKQRLASISLSILNKRGCFIEATLPTNPSLLPFKHHLRKKKSDCLLGWGITCQPLDRGNEFIVAQITKTPVYSSSLHPDGVGTRQSLKLQSLHFTPPPLLRFIIDLRQAALSPYCQLSCHCS